MKIRAREGNGGFVTLVVMALLMIIVGLLMINSASVIRLRREMKQMEARQAQRLGGATNQPTTGKLQSR